MVNKSLNNIKKLEKIINKLIVDQNFTYGLGRSLRRTLKEVKLYKNHIQGTEKLFNKKNSLNTAKIQIGNGKRILKGYLNIDIIPPADLIWDVREGLPLDNECSKFIFCEHFLEHIDYPISVKKFIQECYRILKINGSLILGVPDCGLVIKKYTTRNQIFYRDIIQGWYSKRNCLPHINTYIDLVNYCFRDQDDDEFYNPHLWAYDYEKLISLLKIAGFKKVKNWKFDENIANPKRKFGSIYVMAIK